MKTWLITGCSTGIGRGIAKAALKAGDQVVVTARNTASIEDFNEEYPDRALIQSLDLTDEKSMRQAVDTVLSHFGKIDVLVNNAGYGYRAAIEESEESDIKTMFETNVFGPGKLMNLVLPGMRKQRQGLIINMSSIGAVRAAVGNGYYSASKAALELISEAVDKESSHLGIRVMIVEPGAFRTNFYDSLKGSKKKIEDYNRSVDKMRLENVVNNYEQPGDPLKAGELIVRLVQAGNIPKRLPLGSDAVKVIESELDRRLDELNTVKRFSIQTDYL